MPAQPLTEIKGTPLRGGMVTAREKALLPFGGISAKLNMRDTHPGFKKRTGINRQHTTAISGTTPEIMSLFQFSKGKRTERHFFAQVSDDDVYEATIAPPGQTGAVFGGKVLTGAASSVPASWADTNDIMLFSNGVDQHKLYAGTANDVLRFIKFDGAAAPPDIPTDGIDYTQEVTDGQTTTFAVLDSLNTYALYECIYIATPIPANKLTWTFVTGHENATVATGTLKYRKNDHTWEDTTEADGTLETINGGDATLGDDGSMVWDQPSDEIPCYLFGINAYWYRWETDTQLDAEVEVSAVTYGTDGKANDHFMDLVNVWDGIPRYAIESRFFDKSETSTYYLYATNSIEIDDMVHSADDSEDRLYFNSFDPLVGVYVDVGNTPNTTTTTVIEVKVWTGAAFTALTGVTDGTNGFNNSGWITWKRNTSAQPSQFQNARYYSYWYYINITTATVSSDVILSIETMPYFDIKTLRSEAGAGQANCAWQDRACYSFDRYGQYIHVTSKGNPMTLNGDDFGILEAGDGRSNKTLAMSQFHNEMIAFQQELGRDGGCVTLFEGYSPRTFGKLVLSSKLGILNAKCVAVVDGVMTSTATEEKLKTLCFFLSHYGACVTDGKSIAIFSDDIANYFDPAETTCIARGHDNEHWLAYDSSHNEIVIGLVTGTASVPNKWFAFDLVDKTWSERSWNQAMACMTEVEAASGDIPILQYAGGTNDGAVYRLNTGTNDIDIDNTTTAINSYVDLEFGADGEYMVLRELLLQCKTQAAGDVSLTITQNAISAVAAKALSMVVETATQIVRRHRIPLNITDQLITVRLQHNTASQTMLLEKLGLKLWLWKGR